MLAISNSVESFVCSNVLDLKMIAKYQFPKLRTAKIEQIKPVNEDTINKFLLRNQSIIYIRWT